MTLATRTHTYRSGRPGAIAAAIYALAATVAAGAHPLTYFLGTDEAVRLVAGEGVQSASFGRSAALALAPAHPAAAAIRRAIAEESPSVVVEALFLWRRPASSKASPEAEALAVYNSLRAIGSLQGIRYYSASRSTMRTLYEVSHLIRGPEDRAPLADARLGELPAGPETLYARQKDTTFGDNIYGIALSAGDGYATQSSTNLTPLRLGPLTAVGKGEARLRLLVLAADEGLLVYAASSASAPVLPGIKDRLAASFSNRASAVFAWFARSIDAAL